MICWNMKRYLYHIFVFITAFLWTKSELYAATHDGGTMTGTFTLTDNTQLKSPIIVSGTLTIDLNGYVLYLEDIDGASQVIDVPAGASLIIKDSNPGLGHAGYIDENGLFRWPLPSGKEQYALPGGIIYNPYKNESTGRKGISVAGTCTIQGGTIAGCFDPRIGAAITCSSSGTLIMTGGKIMYNRSKLSDGGLAGVIYGEAPNKNNGSFINLSNVTLSHNKTEGQGGAICGYRVELTDCIFEDNVAGLQGGAIYSRGQTGSLSIDGCTIKNNAATGDGGAIYVANSAPCTIENSDISYNSSVVSGGGINATGELNITNSTISFNSGVNGGGIRVSGECTIDDTVIEHNYATTGGGGIYASGATTITDSYIRDNRAMATETADGLVNKGRGGGFLFTGNDKITDEKDAVPFILDNTKVTGNAAMYYGGGGQLQSKGRLTLQNNSEINSNTSVLKGAAGLHLTGGVYFYMNPGTQISNTTALGGVGGGIHSSYECFIHLDGGKINGNVVYGRGGGVHVNTGGDLVLNGTDITGNKAFDGINLLTSEVIKGSDGKYSWTKPVGDPNDEYPGYGGGLLVNSGSCTMNKGNISNNHAETLGGGIGLIMTESSNYAHYVRLATFTLNSGNVSGNTTDGNGAGVYLMENILNYLSQTEKDKYVQLVAGRDWTPKIILNGGSFSNNIAQSHGGGAYQEQKTEFVVSAGMNAILSGNRAKESGGAVFIAKGNFTVNGTASIIGNKADNGDGGAIYLGVGTSDSPSVFTVGNNGRLLLGGNTSNDGNTAGNHGGGVYCGGSFIANGETSIQNNRSIKDGGAVYVDGGQFSASSTITLKSNSAGGDGGAVYVSGGNISLDENIISNNNAANGGAVFVNGGDFTAEGTTEITGNTATANGGAVYVTGTDIKRGNININGSSSSIMATIVGNYSAGEGGAFYVNNGDITMGLTELSGNGKDPSSVVHTVNGGAIALYDGVFTFADGSEIKNNMATGNGGALYIKNAGTQKSISCEGGSYVGNTASGDGGAIYASGDILLKVTADVRNNIAKNGGGLYLDGGVNMTFGNKNISGLGLIVGNKAIGTSAEEGVGGGIYMAKGILSFGDQKNLGIYNNVATYEAADIYSSGNESLANLPNVSGMNLTGFDVPGNDLYWVVDEHGNRYEDALLDVSKELNLLTFSEATKEVRDEICLDLGYDYVLVTIIVMGLDISHDASVVLSYPDNGIYQEYRNVLFTGTGKENEVRRIVGLPSHNWKFDITDWSYKYDEITCSPDDENDKIIPISRGGTREVTITFKSGSKSNIKDFGTRKVNILRPKNG